MTEFVELWGNVLMIGGGSGGVVALALYLRRVVSGLGLEQAQTNSAINGVGANDKVILNLQTEMDRLAKRVDVLEKQVTQLTEKLANVRLIALDCYQLANECDCVGENRQRLLTHLKQIIKDA